MDVHQTSLLLGEILEKCFMLFFNLGSRAQFNVVFIFVIVALIIISSVISGLIAFVSKFFPDRAYLVTQKYWYEALYDTIFTSLDFGVRVIKELVRAIVWFVLSVVRFFVIELLCFGFFVFVNFFAGIVVGAGPFTISFQDAFYPFIPSFWPGFTILTYEHRVPDDTDELTSMTFLRNSSAQINALSPTICLKIWLRYSPTVLLKMRKMKEFSTPVERFIFNWTYMVCFLPIAIIHQLKDEIPNDHKILTLLTLRLRGNAQPVIARNEIAAEIVKYWNAGGEIAKAEKAYYKTFVANWGHSKRRSTCKSNYWLVGWKTYDQPTESPDLASASGLVMEPRGKSHVSEIDAALRNNASCLNSQEQKKNFYHSNRSIFEGMTENKAIQVMTDRAKRFQDQSGNGNGGFHGRNRQGGGQRGGQRGGQ